MDGSSSSGKRYPIEVCFFYLVCTELSSGVRIERGERFRRKFKKYMMSAGDCIKLVCGQLSYKRSNALT